MGELPIFTTKAHVFQIDPDTKKKWLPLSSTAVSVSYYHDSSRNLYRVISVDGTKVLINSTLMANMTFTKTSQKFGQWSDIKANTVYGLGFSSEDELLKFMEKFDEVKTLSNQSSPAERSKAVESPASASPRLSSILSKQSELGGQKTSEDVTDHLEQLRYENDRLKLALAQSSTNAKKWETELQTLRSNNSRLSAALQESAANVDQWKKQLLTYQEENARLQSQISDLLLSKASDSMPRQLEDAFNKLKVVEQELREKQKDLEEQKILVDQLKPLKLVNHQLEAKVQALNEDNYRLQHELMQASENQQKEERLKYLQKQFGEKLSELHVMNVSMAELLQGSK